jgi:tripartite-type tricarboxylate transporter receptor subunit TctC
MKTPRRTFLHRIGGTAALLFISTVASRAQSFPSHPIKIVVPYPAGGPADTVARVATQGLGAELDVSVFIENVSGAGGRLGTKTVIHSAPDGYTLLLGGSNEYAIAPALYSKLDYDPVVDLLPVAALASESNAIVVNPSVPAHSLAELAHYANDHPGQLTCGSTIGNAAHLTLEFFLKHMRANIAFVPYKGAAPAIADALGNHIQIVASAKPVLLPLIKAGKLRAMAVSSAQRWPELPDIPTFGESGLDGFPTGTWLGLLAPAGTPPDVIVKLNAAENARLNAPETQTAIAKLGLQMQPLSSQDFAKLLGREVQLWKSVVDETGVHLE